MLGTHIRTLKEGTIIFAAGQQQSIELVRDGILLGLELRGTFTITNGASAAVGALAQTIARIFQRIEVKAGGRDTTINIVGPDLASRVHIERQVPAGGMDDTVVLTGAAATVYDFVLPLDLTLPGSRRPDDTALDTRGLNQLTLTVTFMPSDLTDFYTTPNSAAISAVTINVHGRHLMNPASDAAFLVRSLDTVERELTASSDAFDIPIDRGSGLVYRSLMITTEADKIAVNTILDPGTIALEAGGQRFHVVDSKVLRFENRSFYGLSTALTGVYYLDLTHIGQMTTGIPTDQLGADLKLIVNATKVSGTNKIRVQREAVRPFKL